MSTNITKLVFLPLLLSGNFAVHTSVARDFIYVNVAKTWLEAQSYCREKYTDLASVNGMREMQRLINQVDPFYYGDVWIGLRKEAEARWGWSMGKDTVQQYSMLNTASKTFPNGSCGAISQDGQWYSFDCLSLQSSICYDAFRNIIYFQFTKLSWREAQDYCRRIYTDLVDIQNADDQQSVLALVYTDYTWIGLFSDNWKWSDKTTSFFRYWGLGKPLSLFNSSNCAVMQMDKDGMWNDSICDRKAPFMCYKVAEHKKMQKVKLKVRSQSMANLNDPSMKANILKKIEEKLASKKIFNYTIKWREKDGIVFHPESDNIQQKNMPDEL